ncbi:hypothetical protein [Psychroserpens algicola]|uniref:hypothetical protein n=1 Tax=Psychroserpens algicola TaxID=1719034 RepID=UPI00195317F4|nr:hypothetical protein [Psychroserpens algicola]
MKNIKIKKDLIIVLIIIISPFAFYFHVLAPTTKVWDTKFFTIDAGYFENVKNYLWIYAYKTLTILMISIWFVTCKNWWRLVLLIPLSIEFSKFISFLNDRYNFLDNYGFAHSLPIFLMFSFLLLFIAKKLNYYSVNSNTRSELNDEIYKLMNDLSLFNRKESYKIKKKYDLIKKQKDKIEKKEYLCSLIELRNSINE